VPIRLHAGLVSRVRREIDVRRLATVVAASLGLAAAAPAAAQVPRSPPPIYPQPGVAELAPGGQQQIYVIGDSLTHGMQYILPSHFPGWGVGTWGYNGRSLAEGMDILARTLIPDDGSIILGMSLGTAEYPRQVGALEAAVRESLRRVGPNGCVIWATIYRPPRNGVGYGSENEALRAMERREPRMQLVDWSKSLHAHPLPMDATGVHPTTIKGWQRRAQMFEDAARSCGAP
jgi:hypothetical protein